MLNDTHRTSEELESETVDCVLVANLESMLATHSASGAVTLRQFYLVHEIAHRFVLSGIVYAIWSVNSVWQRLMLIPPGEPSGPSLSRVLKPGPWH